MQKTKFVFASFLFIKTNAKNKKLTRSREIISQSKFSIMLFERDNKSWPRDNQPIKLLLMTYGRLLIDVGFFVFESGHTKRTDLWIL